jgi:serine/threonine protein kinase/Flp pilus assembly protein TadD
MTPPDSEQTVLMLAVPTAPQEDRVTANAEAPGGEAPGGRTLLEEAYSEYCRRQEQGAAPDREQFCAEYPAIERELAVMLSLHRQARVDPTFLAEPAWPRPGEFFLGFELHRELGRGALSRVFLASEPALGHRQVVVKLSQIGGVEASTLGRLEHPNIVPVYSVHTDEKRGLSAICMPYLGEATLCDVLIRVLAESRPPKRSAVILEAARATPSGEATARPTTASQSEAFPCRAGYTDGIRHLAEQLLDALTFIHAEGVCHRDLKPSNVLLTQAGVPMLLDFNLARDVRRADLHSGGTPLYMSPEQLRLMGIRDASAGTVDARSDLFSLGVILYELLTGEHPFGPPPLGQSLVETCHRLVDRQQVGARPVRQVNGAVDRDLAQLVDCCLAFAPEQRPASAEAARALVHKRAGLSTRLGVRPRVWLATLLLAALAAGVSFVASPFLFPATQTSLTHWQRAQERYREQDYEAAIEHLTRHLQANPDDAEAWLLRGKAAAQQGESSLPSAIIDLRKAYQLRKHGPTKAYLGYLFQQLGHLFDARHCYEEALDDCGCETAEILNNLSSILVCHSDFEQAEARATRALELNPQLQAAYHNRGLVCLQQALKSNRTPSGQSGRSAPNANRRAWLQRAIADLDRAVEIGPQSGELCRDAARVCALLAPDEQGRVAQAIAHLEQAIRHGLPPSDLEHEPFRGALSHHPQFDSVLHAQGNASNPATARARRVLAVLPD